MRLDSAGVGEEAGEEVSLRSRVQVEGRSNRDQKDRVDVSFLALESPGWAS
jgi:hypothetical protein